jgi:hypothetical protein
MFYKDLKAQRLYRCFARTHRLLPTNTLCSNSKSSKHNQTIEQADTKTCDLWRYKF